MKRLLFIAASFLMFSTFAFASVSAVLPPQQEAPAYLKYQKRPKNELSKLVYLMDRFKGSEYKVVFDKAEYDSVAALQTAKNYIAKHYDNQNASDWVQEHAYRSPSGQIIYLKTPDGKTEILRDALVNELKTLG